jgi:acetate kinase
VARLIMTETALSPQPILAINSGSSSLKLGLFDCDTPRLRGEVEGIGQSGARLRVTDAGGRVLIEKQQPVASQEDALSSLITILREHANEAPIAIGHRIVHGGPALLEHQRITPTVLDTLAAAEHFAPLHIPQSLRLIRQTEQLFPGVPQIACLDTAFHRHMPEVARRFPLPTELDRHGIHRYGFHGLSFESLVHRLGNPLPERVILAHLGSGSSLCALQNGVSIDTSMGLTPLGGVVMATRSGDLDPGVLLYLLRSGKNTPDTLEELLNRQAGLVALSEGEPDMQKLLARRSAGDQLADLAVTAYVTSVRKAIGAYAALLGGLDLLVFTGGIGEHSDEIRSLICSPIEFLGVSIANGKVIALATEEEEQIARICVALMNSAQ